MILTKTFEGVKLTFDIDYCPEEGSTSSASEHYYGGHFEVESVKIGDLDITDLLGEDRVEQLGEELADLWYNTDEFSPY